MKRHATTIVLCLVAGLLAVWLFLDRDRVSEGERRRRENNVFVAWRREELSKIELVRAAAEGEEAESIVLERDVKGDGPWRLNRERADQQAVERLLQSLELATVQRKAAGDGALGLEAPRASGTITMGAVVHRFALGGPSPRPEGSSYLRVGDEAPIVVSKDFTRTILAPGDTYRDRTVVPYLSLELATFSVAYPDGGLTLEHIKGRFFRVAQHGLVASRAGTERIWGALAEVRAEAFPKDAVVDELVAKPVLTMTLVPRDGRPFGEIVFGGPCPGHPDDVVVLRKKPTRVAACAPKGALEALRVDPASIVEQRPFLLDHDEVEEIRFEDGPDSGGTDAGAPRPARVDLARKGNGWRSRTLDRDLTPDEADAVSELVSRLTASPTGKIRRGDHEPTMPVLARVTVRAGDHEETVEVGRVGEDGLVQVRRAFDLARLYVPVAAARRLLPRETITRARTLLEDARPVARMRLRCGAPQDLATKAGRMELVQPSGFETDGSVVSLLEAFTRGKVDRWVADVDDGTFGLATSACRVVVGFEDGNAPATIVLGSEGEGGIYGAIDGRPGVFVAPLALRDLASALYVNRASLRTEPSRITSVRVVRAPRGEALTAPAEVLREAAAGLYAERVLAAGEGAKLEGSVDVELAVASADAGRPRVIRCSPLPSAEPGGSPPAAAPPPSPRARHACAVSDVQATFAVSDERLALFLGTPTAGDAGAPRDAAVARDAAPR